MFAAPAIYCEPRNGTSKTSTMVVFQSRIVERDPICGSRSRRQFPKAAERLCPLCGNFRDGIG
jgi:hypothetical protein